MAKIAEVKIRLMRQNDLAQMLAIQAVCYTEIVPETRTSLLAKLAASPTTCFVALLNGQIVGYLLSVPWEFSNPPALNAQNCQLPDAPDCLYLHDLAIAPAGRGAGVGQRLVDAFMQTLYASGLCRACLIAIQGSASYWKRFGFEPVAMMQPLADRLETYGQGAQYLCLDLAQ